MEDRWASLHQEILIHIFSLLNDFQSFHSLSQVCRSWREASLDSACWDPLHLSDHKSFISSFIKEEDILDPNVNQRTFFLLKRCGGNVKSISYRSIANDSSLHQIAERCPLLESLSLRNCGSVSREALCQVLKSCKEMKLLDLSGCNCLNAKAIHEVEGLCPKLIGLRYGRHLGFSGGHINLEMGQAIGKSFPNLKWLNLRGSGIDRYGLQSILESCKGLEYLNVMGCPRLTQCSTLTDKVADILEFKCSKISNFYNYDHEYDQDFNGFDLGYS